MKLTNFQASGTVLKLEIDLGNEVRNLQGVALVQDEDLIISNDIERGPLLEYGLLLWGDRPQEEKSPTGEVD